LSHLPWYRESDRDQVWKKMALIICILVATDWLDWVRFKDYFCTVGRDLLYPKFDDSNLPLDDATEQFLPEDLWTSFLRDQYIFTPIFIHEDSHEKIYSAKFRLPILESTPVDEEGAQGKVYKIHVDGRFVTYGGGRINSNVQLMAMKRIAAKKQRDFRAETKALTHFTRCLLQSRNIMKSISSFVLGTDFVILSPWAEGKDLHQFLYYPDKVFPNFPELSRRFSPNNLLTEALSLAQALEFLHNQMTTDRGRKLRCAHLDLKPENILVCFPPDAHPDSCPVGQWKITDFGMAKVEQSVVGQEIVQEHQEQDPAPGNVLRDLSSQPPMRGEGAFQPPEVQTRDKAKVSTRRDVWSFGCVLAMVLAYALGGPEEVAKQHQFRATGTDDFFYLRRRQPRAEPRLSAPTLHRVPAEIKPNIQRWLENAPAMRNAIHVEWIGACCQLILSLLNVDVVQRPEIVTAIFHLGRIIRHTEVHARERMWEFGDASTAPEVVPTTIPQLAVRRSSNDSGSEINAEFMGVRSIAATSSAQSPQKGAPSSASFTSFWKADDTISFLNLEPPNKEVRVNKACLAPSGGWAALYSPTTVFTYDLKRLGDDPAVWTARPSNSSLPTEKQSLTSMQVIKGSQQSSIEHVLIRGKFLALVERTEKPSPSVSQTPPALPETKCFLCSGLHGFSPSRTASMIYIEASDWLKSLKR
jgi:serine/threonine protein kinase